MTNCRTLVNLEGGLTTTYTLAPQVHGTLVSQRRSGATAWHHYDALGSTERLTDSAQAALATYLHTAFGVPKAATGNHPNRLRFIGRHGYRWEPDVSEYDVRQRRMKAERGRWLGDDALRVGINWYAYCANLPTLLTDPSGLAAGGSGCLRFHWDFNLQPRPGFRTPAWVGWNTVSRRWYETAAWWAIHYPQLIVPLVLGGPKTASYALHWADNTGSEKWESMQEIFGHNPAEKQGCNDALACAVAFVEARIRSATPQRIMTGQCGPYVFPSSEHDWEWAIGGHVSYGYGWASLRCGKYVLRFAWVLEDTFTMAGKFPSLHQWHLKGLAQDFWVSSRLQKTFTWEKGHFSGSCS